MTPKKINLQKVQQKCPQCNKGKIYQYGTKQGCDNCEYEKTITK